MGKDGQHKLIYAAGVVAALLLALIVYAVVRTSQGSVERQPTLEAPIRTVPTSTATTIPTTMTTPSATSTTDTSTTSTTSTTDTSPTSTLDSPTASASILVPPTTTSLTPPFSITPDTMPPSVEVPNP